jgi:hypothetical protein
MRVISIVLLSTILTGCGTLFGGPDTYTVKEPLDANGDGLQDVGWFGPKYTKRKTTEALELTDKFAEAMSNTSDMPVVQMDCTTLAPDQLAALSATGQEAYFYRQSLCEMMTRTEAIIRAVLGRPNSAKGEVAGAAAEAIEQLKKQY